MEREHSSEQERAVEAGDRRAYHRPRILHREPLEVMAAVCAPAPPAKRNAGLCPQGPRSS
jgi:hypothetical protein